MTTPRRVVPPSHGPSYESFGHVLIPPALHEDVDDEAVLVHRPPQPVSLAIDLQRDFVQVQLIARPTATPSQLLCEHRAELAHPLADRLIAHRHPPFCQQLLHIPQAERKAQVQTEVNAFAVCGQLSGPAELDRRTKWYALPHDVNCARHFRALARVRGHGDAS
jgi:hypothetical protein